MVRTCHLDLDTWLVPGQVHAETLVTYIHAFMHSAHTVHAEDISYIHSCIHALSAHQPVPRDSTKSTVFSFSFDF